MAEQDDNSPPRTWSRASKFAMALTMGIAALAGAAWLQGVHLEESQSSLSSSVGPEVRGLWECEWVQNNDDCSQRNDAACDCRRDWCNGNGARGHGKCAE